MTSPRNIKLLNLYRKKNSGNIIINVYLRIIVITMFVFTHEVLRKYLVRRITTLLNVPSTAQYKLRIASEGLEHKLWDLSHKRKPRVRTKHFKWTVLRTRT